MPKIYESTYKSAAGDHLTHKIEVHASPDEAARAFAEDKKFPLLPDESLKESGNKLIKSHYGGNLSLRWVCGSSVCEVRSQDHEGAMQFAESLPYK